MKRNEAILVKRIAPELVFWQQRSVLAHRHLALQSDRLLVVGV